MFKKILFCLSLLCVGVLAGLALAPTEKAHAADSVIQSMVTRTIRADRFCVDVSEGAGTAFYTLADSAGDHDRVMVQINSKGDVAINGQTLDHPPATATIRSHAAVVVGDMRELGKALADGAMVAP